MNFNIIIFNKSIIKCKPKISYVENKEIENAPEMDALAQPSI